MLKSIVFALAFWILGTLSLYGQNQVPALEWVATWGGTSYESLWESKMDNDGNIINVGFFQGTTDLDPGPGVVQYTSSPGVISGFIQKLDSNGNLLWVRVIKGMDNVLLLDVGIDSGDSIIVSGYFVGSSLDVDPDSAQTFFVSGGSDPTILILKLTDQGDFVWGVSQVGLAEISDFEVDSNANIYATGNFHGTFDSDPAPGSYVPVSPMVNGQHDFFVQKLNAAGQQLWFKTVEGTGNVKANSVSLSPGGGLVIGGQYRDMVDFDPGPGTSIKINSISGPQGFILQLSDTGTYQQVQTLEGSGKSKIWDVQVAGNGDIYFAGSYDGNADFEPGSGITGPISSNHEGWFIEKLDHNGMFQWVRPYRASLAQEQTYPVHLCVNADRLYLTGYFEESDLRLEPGQIGGIILPHVGARDIFIARHDTSGSLIWAQSFASIITAQDRALSVFEDSSKSVYISGYYAGSIDFDPYGGNTQTTTNGVYDAFVLKFSPCPPVLLDTFKTQACRYYETQSGQHIYNDSLVAIDTVRYAEGCDSLILWADVQIMAPPTDISYSSGTLTWDHWAIPGADTFSLQWYNCDSVAIIPGDTGYSFSPVYNGYYALIVDSSGCVDTSNCILVDDLSLERFSSMNHVSVYPNPTEDMVFVTGVEDRILSLTLTDIMGREVRKVDNQDYISLYDLTPGIYFLRIQTGAGEAVRKVVRE